jgi:hypothetical protein
MQYLRNLFALGGVLVVLGAAAAPAMAEPHFSDTTHGIKVSGSVTAYKNGLQPLTCTAPTSMVGEFFDAQHAVVESFGLALQLKLSCSNGRPLGLVSEMTTASTTSLWYGGSLEHVVSPWDGGGEYVAQGLMVGDWKNGSGSTASTVTFLKDKAGTTLDGYPVTISGTLKVTTSTGGLLTILP